ncbi:dermonecrotic toxin domain-containing protein [Pseudomonas putida]
MNDIKQRVERGLDVLDAGLPLIHIVDEIIREYPDPFMLASDHAARILHEQTGKPSDPRFVWWHQFDRVTSDRQSFNGWQHSDAPQKSMLLSELVIQRFDLRFQQAPDELDLYGGFYRQGPHARRFDAHNEVPMLASKVQEALWTLDFSVGYRQAITRFWTNYGGYYRVLAKVNLLGQAAVCKRDGLITDADWTRLRDLCSDGLAANELPTLAKLQRDSTGTPLTASRYVLGQDDRGCLCSLQAADGRVFLYLPWSYQAFRAFDSMLAMAGWLRRDLQDADKLQAYTVAAFTNTYDPAHDRMVRTHLKSIADSASDAAAEQLLGFLKQPLGVDVFTYLANLASFEMHRHAASMLDNSRLRKSLWSGYLAAFFKVAGGLAPLGWPVSLTLLGAGIGKVALDVDAALHATDEQTRKGALREAMLDSLFSALSMADVAFQTSFASLAHEAPPHEVKADLQNWGVARYSSLPMEELETNQLLTGEVVQAGRLRGISIHSDGSCWIVLSGLSYRVRYSQQLNVWLVVPADNPYAFSPLHPVRLNEVGEWQLLVPAQLQGGSPAPIKDVPVTQSAFWDTYTSLDGVQNKRLSTGALVRQKEVLAEADIHSFEEGQEPDLDSHGLDCRLVDGVPQYSYRYGRQYFNTMLEYYTNEESRINDVFRYGRYGHDDADDYIRDLADTLEPLPKSNAVTLYRGGHASRGTSGAPYRLGLLEVGDVLVNTDMTSFTENPYRVIDFASTLSAQGSTLPPRVFDDTSVIFELPAGRYQGGTPISPFSVYWDEAETLFQPGNYFRIDSLKQVYGEHYHFIHVLLSKTVKPAAGPVYDLRTGLLFDLDAYRARFKTPALVQRFFPD